MKNTYPPTKAQYRGLPVIVKDYSESYHRCYIVTPDGSEPFDYYTMGGPAKRSWNWVIPENLIFEEEK